MKTKWILLLMFIWTPLSLEAKLNCKAHSLEKIYLQKKEKVKISLCEKEYQRKKYLVSPTCLKNCSLLKELESLPTRMPFSSKASPQALLCNKLEGKYTMYRDDKDRLSLCHREEDIVEASLLYQVMKQRL